MYPYSIQVINNFSPTLRQNLNIADHLLKKIYMYIFFLGGGWHNKSNCKKREAKHKNTWSFILEKGRMLSPQFNTEGSLQSAVSDKRHRLDLALPGLRHMRSDRRPSTMAKEVQISLADLIAEAQPRWPLEIFGARIKEDHIRSNSAAVAAARTGSTADGAIMRTTLNA